MKPIYKKLMEQHGGSIPFEILGGVKQKKTTRRPVKRRSRPKKRKDVKTKRRGQILNTDKYSPGTIIRKNGQLWKLTQSRKWTKIHT